jgi:hypothetical protein
MVAQNQWTILSLITQKFYSETNFEVWNFEAKIACCGYFLVIYKFYYVLLLTNKCLTIAFYVFNSSRIAYKKYLTLNLI